MRGGVIDTGISEEALTDPWLKNILPGPADLDKLQEVESGTDRAGRLRLQPPERGRLPTSPRMVLSSR